MQRNPAILYGLGNLVENAVDFAHERVEIAARWSEQDVAVTITRRRAGLRAGDHATGSASLMSRAAPPHRAPAARTSGLGLGFFIAKTLLERSGATLDFENRQAPGARRRGQGALAARRISRRRRRWNPPDLLSRETCPHSYAYVREQE